MAAARDDEWRAEVSERTRGERAAVDLPSRIAGAKGATLTVMLRDGERVTGELLDCAHTWLLLGAEGGRQHLMPVTSLTWVSGLGVSGRQVTEVERRLGITHALRALSRDRARVRVRVSGGEVHGVIAAVLADHIEVTTDRPGKTRVAVSLTAVLEVVSN